MSEILELQKVTTGYRENPVLKELDFSVEENEIFGVIGPNASGKSTLLRVIDRVIQPWEGKVLFRGKNLVELDKKEVARSISVVPQEFNVNYSLTVEELVRLGRTPHLGVLSFEDEEDEEIVKDSLELTDTEFLRNRSFHDLSGGEKQRVIIAKALAQDPELLLLDEPINHLDINNQEEVLNLLRRLVRERDLTIVSTFHDLNLASRYCQSLILLENGRVHSKGDPTEVITEDTINKVYGTEVAVTTNPETDALTVTPLSQTLYETNQRKQTRVHIISGGGTGKPLMAALKRQGYRITAGVLTSLDDDYREAKRLGISLVENNPFTNISEKAAQKNKELIEKADIIVITDMPIGSGNLKNLKLAKEAAKEKKVIQLGKTPIDERDYTEGKATEIFKKLQKSGLEKFSGVKELLEYINKNTKDNTKHQS